jgi:hypothetical protein
MPEVPMSGSEQENPQRRCRELSGERESPARVCRAAPAYLQVKEVAAELQVMAPHVERQVVVELDVLVGARGEDRWIAIVL